MRFAAISRLAAAALATGALLVSGITPAHAATYPPHVSVLYASPVLSGGYAAVGISGDHLTSGLTVRASRSSHKTVAKVSVDSSGTTGTALIKVSSVLSTTAGRYTVNFVLEGASVQGAVTTTQTYTVGKQISIKSLKVTRKSYGLYISGKAASRTPVKLTIKFGSKTYTRSAKAGSSGSFSYRFHKTSKGTYTVTAQVSANKKYFSSPVTVTYRRS